MNQLLNCNKLRSFADFCPTSLKFEEEKGKFKKSLEIFQIHSINFSSLFNFVHFVARQSLGAVASVCLECQKSTTPPPSGSSLAASRGQSYDVYLCLCFQENVRVVCVSLCVCLCQNVMHGRLSSCLFMCVSLLVGLSE